MESISEKSSVKSFKTKKLLNPNIPFFMGLSNLETYFKT